MANNKNKANNKITKDMIIANNIGLVEVLYYVFKGQVLEMDIKEFCIKHQVYQTEKEIDTVIKKLINSNIIKITKLVNTNNNVIVAKAPIYKHFGEEGKTTRYSIETVTRNSYINFILCKVWNIRANNIKELGEKIEKKSTLLSSKRNVSSCTKIFENKLTTYGASALEDAYIKEEQRKVHLKNIEKAEVVTRAYMISETLQTLRERDIYVIDTGADYKVMIIDNNTDFRLASLSRKIALILRVFKEHIEVQENLDIYIFLKNNIAKERLKDNFISKLKNGEIKINLDKSINEEIKSSEFGSNLNLDYELKKQENDVYTLENVYTFNTIKEVHLRLVNTDISNRHNAEFKRLRLVEHKKELNKKSIRAELLAELKAKGLLIQNDNELDDI